MKNFIFLITAISLIITSYDSSILAKKVKTSREMLEELKTYKSYQHHEILGDYISGVFTIRDQFIHMIDIDRLLLSHRMNAFKGE